MHTELCPTRACMKHKGCNHRRVVYSCCVAGALCALISLLLSTVPIPPRSLQLDTPDMPDLSSEMVAPHPTVAIIGSGLAGLVAALDASRAAAAAGQDIHVVVLEKNSNLGGNSAKASSGINAVNSDAGDTRQQYANDTLQSGGGLSDEQLVAQLAGSSQAAVQQLEACGVALSKVVRLGGHSAPRTRSNPAGPNVGFAIIKAVSSCVQQEAHAKVLTHTQVTALDKDASGKLRLTYTQQLPATTQPSSTSAAAAAGKSHTSSSSSSPAGGGGNQVLLADAVVLATGGFAASKELLQRYAPQAALLPTTNGPWATGEGLALGVSLGGALTQMGEVQVHPTGFVDPADPDAGTKWLAPEKLRGCGALLLSSSGRRFVDELTTRDKVAAAIQGLPGQRCWLLLGREGAEEFGEGTLWFYGSKKMVTKCDTLSAAAAHMGADAAVLEQELGSYAAAAEGRQPDVWGKRYFPTQVSPGGPFWVAQVTPVVHYCMGGLRIDAQTRVLDDQGRAIPGLFAAGEVSGGLHGKNRLGGNSLAECAVFGRVAGQQAVAYVQQQLPAAKVVGVGVKSAGGESAMATAATAVAAV